MNCKEIKTKLSAYQDKEIAQPEKIKIKEHLKSCSDCSNTLEELNFAWQVLGQIETIDSAPFFWTRLSQRIEKEEQKFSKRKFIKNPLRLIPATVVTVSLLIFGLMTGFYLGKTISQQFITSHRSTIEQDEGEILAINSFDEYTGESVSDVYVSLMSDNSQ